MTTKKIIKPLTDFIVESNAIEGIHRAPTEAEIKEAERFMALKRIIIDDVVAFVKVYQPNAKLRTETGCNVFVGNHMPPGGGMHITYRLQEILSNASDSFIEPYETHIRYELLHPFTDGNGRSGRMLWLWQSTRLLGRLPELSFLHNFYYEALNKAAWGV